MSSTGTYLGPHIKTGPSSYLLGPIPITGHLPTMTSMYMGNVAWGLYDGPRRGEGSGSGKLNPLTPFMWDDFVGEHKYLKIVIDEEYTGVFNKLSETVKNEIEQKKFVARGGLVLSPINAAQKDLETTVKVIKSKTDEYQAKVPAAHALYGLNPLFLMVDLPFRKIYEGVHAAKFNEALAEIDSAYRAALELKRISLENTILVNQLPLLAKKIDQAKLAPGSALDQTASWVGNSLSVIDTEKDFQIQLLPYFLQEHIVKSVPPLEGTTHSQALQNYLTAIESKIKIETAAIGPYKSVNRDSPHIKSPMSKPELEALHKLVELQANTDLGKRWADYHDSLLHSESVRQLTDTANAFKDLAARAREAEAKEREEKQKQNYIDSVNFAAASGERILQKYGANMSNIALEMQASISGSKIRSFNDAMTTFEKVRVNPNTRLSAQDTKAVVDALRALDKATFADNVTRLGKAFGVVGYISQANSVREAAAVGFETGSWKPLMLELEAMALGIGAGALLAVIFALTAPVWSSTAVGVVVVAVLMAAIASLFNAKSVDKINNLVLN